MKYAHYLLMCIMSSPITDLRAEIERLRLSGMSTSDTAYSASLAEISTLKDRLQEKEREMEEINRWKI